MGTEKKRKILKVMPYTEISDGSLETKVVVTLLRKKSGISWVRNSSTNAHIKIVKKTGHAAEADSQVRRARSLVEGCDLLGRCSMMVSGPDTDTCRLLE